MSSRTAWRDWSSACAERGAEILRFLELSVALRLVPCGARLGSPRKAAIHRSPVCGPLTRGKRLESLSHTSHFPLSPFRGRARLSTERDERSRRFEFASVTRRRSIIWSQEVDEVEADDNMTYSRDGERIL